MGGFCLCCKKSQDTSPMAEPKMNFDNTNELLIQTKEKNNCDKIANINTKTEKENVPIEKYDDSNATYSEKGLNLNENIGDDEPLIRADSPLICDYEKGVITFTKNGLIKLFNELWALDNFKNISDKDNLLIQLRYEGTPMNQQFYLIKMVYKIKKSELKYNKDIESFMEYSYGLSLRPMWDEALKSLERYEGNDIASIVCTWGKSPVFFVSERETIEKRFRFKIENNIYCMSMSIPLDIYEPKPDVVRFIDFINLYKISDEDEFIIFRTLNQVDFKMPIPQMLINITLPSTSRTWYNNIKNFANRIIYDKENKTYELKNEGEKKNEN